MAQDVISLARFARRNEMKVSTAAAYLGRIDPQIVVKPWGRHGNRYVDLHRLAAVSPDHAVQRRLAKLEGDLEDQRDLVDTLLRISKESA